jgi:hypothetical protein
VTIDDPPQDPIMALRGCLGLILFLALFIGGTLVASRFVPDGTPSTVEPARPSAPATAPPADGGSFATPAALLAVFQPGPDHCDIREAPPERLQPTDVREAKCFPASAGDAGLTADVYESASVMNHQMIFLRALAERSDLDVSVLLGVNWSLQGSPAVVERVRLWLGGRLLAPG